MLARIFACCTIVAAVTVLTANPGLAEPGIALVIGNAAYDGDLVPLANPANDARLMAATLKKAGFDVMEAENLNQTAMKRAVAAFGAKLAASGSDSTGLFFFAGYGARVRGSFLIPVGADIARESAVELEALRVGDVLKQMEFAGAKVKILLLDASRDNKFRRSTRSIDWDGEFAMSSDTFIGYSTTPGDTAADGSGHNSPYTTAVASTLLTPGIPIAELFQSIRAKVLDATDHRHVTCDVSTLAAPFYFIPPK